MRNKIPNYGAFAGLFDIGITQLIDLFVYKFLISRNKFNENVEIDRGEIWKRICKMCDVFSPVERTIERSLERLEKAGLITVVYKLGFGKLVIKVKSLDDIDKNICQPETEESEPQNPEPPNSKKNEKTGDKQQQHIDWRTLTETKKICMDAGLHYRLEKDLREIASHGREKLMATIRLYLKRAGNPLNKIVNPCAWFRKALKDNYYLDEPIEAESIPMLEQMYFQAKEKLIELTGCLPKKITEEVGYAPT